MLVGQPRDSSQTKPAKFLKELNKGSRETTHSETPSVHLQKQGIILDTKENRRRTMNLDIHTSCNSRRESNVFLDEVISSEYAVETFSSSEQKEDLTVS